MQHSSNGTRRTIDWQDVAAPAVLLLTGLLLTSGACLQWLSLEKMQNLWPAALLLSGLARIIGPNAGPDPGRK